MFYQDTDEIRRLVNRNGSMRKPFLFAINFEMTEGFFVSEPKEQQDILFQFHNCGNKKAKELEIGEVRFSHEALPYEEYARQFDVVHQGLKRGNSFLTNLTVRTPIETNLDLSDIFAISNSPYQLYVPNRFVCFSPERFVKMSSGRMATNPMKGTIDASIPNAEQIILNDFKETAEHNTIVDLLRNDLSTICDDVRVDRFRYVDRIDSKRGGILQVSSEISGKLPPNYHERIGDILWQMLPAGSISGAPKKATISLIQLAECEPRGYYTGIVGYYDGESFDSAVLIRFIEQDENKQLYYRSGGGITAYSNCREEYEEVLKKIYLPFT